MAERLEYIDIFERNIGIYTQEQQDLLRRSTVSIGGVGGPGGIAAITLARMGIGRLKIADPDVFEAHNMNRQPGANMDTLGMNKTDAMALQLLNINPHLTITTYRNGVNSECLEHFLEGADVIIDAIDYSAPLVKLNMYRGAREQGQYVLSSPISGLGSLVFCFDPNGMTVEEAFGFPDDDSLVPTHRIEPKRLIGADLDYIDPNFFDILRSGAYIPVVVPAVLVAGAAVATDVLKILMIQEREQNPDAFSHIDDIPLTVVPYARRYDVWDASKGGIIDLRTIR